MQDSYFSILEAMFPCGFLKATCWYFNLLFYFLCFITLLFFTGDCERVHLRAKFNSDLSFPLMSKGHMGAFTPLNMTCRVTGPNWRAVVSIFVKISNILIFMKGEHKFLFHWACENPLHWMTCEFDLVWYAVLPWTMVNTRYSIDVWDAKEDTSSWM